MTMTTSRPLTAVPSLIDMDDAIDRGAAYIDGVMVQLKQLLGGQSYCEHTETASAQVNIYVDHPTYVRFLNTPGWVVPWPSARWDKHPTMTRDGKDYWFGHVERKVGHARVTLTYRREVPEGTEPEL